MLTLYIKINFEDGVTVGAVKCTSTTLETRGTAISWSAAQIKASEKRFNSKN